MNSPSGMEGFLFIRMKWNCNEAAHCSVSLRHLRLIAGAFILASLERVFRVEAVRAPTYRLALLTALAFLLVAPLPLQLRFSQPRALV